MRDSFMTFPAPFTSIYIQQDDERRNAQECVGNRRAAAYRLDGETTNVSGMEKHVENFRENTAPGQHII